MTSSQAPHKRYIYRAHDAARMPFSLCSLLTVIKCCIKSRLSAPCCCTLSRVIVRVRFSCPCKRATAQQEQQQKKRRQRKKRNCHCKCIKTKCNKNTRKILVQPLAEHNKHNKGQHVKIILNELQQGWSKGGKGGKRSLMCSSCRRNENY